MKFLSLLLFGALYSQTLWADILPVAASWNGVGGIYGVAYKTGTQHELVVGAAGGNFSAYGGMYKYHATSALNFSMAVGSINDAKILTAYERGITTPTNTYIQKLSGTITGLGTTYWANPKHVKLTGGILNSVVKFDGFQTAGGRVIQLPKANLFDVTTTSLNVGSDFYFVDNIYDPHQGTALNLKAEMQTGRKGQSDSGILDYGVTQYIPLAGPLTLVLAGSMSDGFVVNKKSKYDTRAEIETAFAIDCAQATGTQAQADCAALRDDLINYVEANNKLGQARALGGSGGLRSYRELRFRAAHTALATSELRWRLQNKRKSRIDLIGFIDVGHASDNRNDLFKKSKSSYGAGVNFGKSSSVVKLQAANGSEGGGWSLSFGSSI